MNSPHFDDFAPGSVRSIPALPVLSTELRLFSSQIYSVIVHSRCRRRFDEVVYGAARTTGSVTVVSMLMFSGSASRNRSMMRILSLWGTPAARVVLGENPMV